METLLRHKQDPIPSLLDLDPQMPCELDDVCKRMLAKRPSDRFAAMSLVVSALEQSRFVLSDVDFETSRNRMQSRDHDSMPLDLASKPAISEVSVASTPATSTNRPRSSLAVLITEGSLGARVHFRNTLTNLGFTQLSDVSDGVKAMDVLAAHRFDLIVTGLNLLRVDGRRLIEHVRQSPASCDTPILVVTIESAPAKLHAAARRCVRDHRQKLPHRRSLRGARSTVSAAVITPPEPPRGTCRSQSAPA